jgi:hypothetical protein
LSPTPSLSADPLPHLHPPPPRPRQRDVRVPLTADARRLRHMSFSPRRHDDDRATRGPHTRRGRVPTRYAAATTPAHFPTDPPTHDALATVLRRWRLWGRPSYAVKCLLHMPTRNAGCQRRLHMQEIANLHQSTRTSSHFIVVCDCHHPRARLLPLPPTLSLSADPLPRRQPLCLAQTVG